MKDTLMIDFGALAPTIAEQCKQQGFTLDTKHAQHCQKISNAIILLNITGFINDRMVDTANKKLIKLIFDKSGA